MTRKDLELVAQALNDSKPRDQQQKDQWVWTIEILAAKLSTTNPRFDRDRFKKACGM
jgi:hypothetical protein